MNIFSTVRFWVYAAIAVLIAGLAWTSNHYHDKWVKAQQEIAVKELELDNAVKAAKTCSKNTELLRKQSEEKSDRVAEAQSKANQLAKKNQALSQKLLAAQSKNPDRCSAAVDLYKDYKAQLGVK